MYTPGTPLRYFNDGGGGVQQVHILYPKKIPTSEFAEAQWTLVREETHLK